MTIIPMYYVSIIHWLCLRKIKCNHVNYAEITIFVVSNNDERRTCAHVEEPTGLTFSGN